MDEASGSQEVVPGKDEVGSKTLDVPVGEGSLSTASVCTVQEKGEASGAAENTVDLPDKKIEAKAWSTNEVRADVPDGTWSAKEARVKAQVVTDSAVDCNNGAQVTVVTDDGGASADALVQPEVGGMEHGSLSHTGANGAAVADGGDDLPLVTMEPKDPVAEESVPAADDKLKDPVEGSSSKQMEISPTGGLQEVDTVQTTTGEATPLASKESDSVSLECKVEDSAGLVQVQDKQLGPVVEAGGSRSRRKCAGFCRAKGRSAQ